VIEIPVLNVRLQVVQTIGLSGTVRGETALLSGRYIVDIVLEEGSSDKAAAYRETVVILPGLSTAVTFAPSQFVEAVDTLTFTSLAEFRAYVEGLPKNSAANPYGVSLKGIALEDLQEGMDSLGVVFSALGPKRKSGMSADEYENGRYIALDLSGCTGTDIGSIASYFFSDIPADIDAGQRHLTLPNKTSCRKSSLRVALSILRLIPNRCSGTPVFRRRYRAVFLSTFKFSAA
jgi:hypothetical protein